MKANFPRHSWPGRQRGMTLGGVMFLMFLMGFVAYAGFRVVPAYMDYWLVEKVLKNTLDDPDILKQKDRAIRDSLARAFSLNNIKVVQADEVEIERTESRVDLSVGFSIRQPFMGPINLCMEFQARAASR